VHSTPPKANNVIVAENNRSLKRTRTL